MARGHVAWERLLPGLAPGPERPLLPRGRDTPRGDEQPRATDARATARWPGECRPPGPLRHDGRPPAPLRGRSERGFSPRDRRSPRGPGRRGSRPRRTAAPLHARPGARARGAALTDARGALREWRAAPRPAPRPAPI